MKSIRIAIVGGGSAGPAAALLLKRKTFNSQRVSSRFSFSQHFPFLKREMVKGMAGIKRGIVRKDLKI